MTRARSRLTRIGPRLALTFSLAATMLCGGTPRASAVVPGDNGKIVFTTTRDGNWEIYSIWPDGTGAVNLTNDLGDDVQPAWSPDGTRIAFVSYRDGNAEIYVMNSDGSGQTRLTGIVGDDVEPVWSPNGAKIAFVSQRAGNFEIYVMNPNGTGVTRITNNGGDDEWPDWSPDGTKIAFTSDRGGGFQIYTMAANGAGVSQLTFGTGYSLYPAWSPNGTEIAFAFDTSRNFENPDIFRMNADGTGATLLTSPSAVISPPAWSPDGTQISFSSVRDLNPEIYVMDRNGLNLTRVTFGDYVDRQPDWQPLHIPFIQQLMPPVKPVGQRFKIHGTQLRWTTGVAFIDPATGGLLPARFRVLSDTDVYVWVPDGASTGPIWIQTATGSSTSTMNFLVKPAITGFDPPSGLPGTSVVILGSAFTGATQVTFRGLPAEFSVDGYGQITAIVPSGARTGPIRVTTPGGVARSPARFFVM